MEIKINKKKLKAFGLRKKKKSYNEIAKLLNVSKGTVACWFKGIDWSEDIKKQLTEKAEKISRERLIRLNNLKKIKWSKIYENAYKEAVKEFNLLKNNSLFIAGIMIYWGEGDKIFKNGHVRISNTDPKMLCIFNKFLQKICKIELNKIKCYILIYPDLNPKKCLKFWSLNINIAKEKFYNPIIIQGRHKTKRLNYGVCSINVSSKYLKKKILAWIELFSNQFRSADIV